MKLLGCDDVDWIDLARHKNKWRAVVSTVHDLGVLKMQKLSCSDEELLAYQKDAVTWSEVFIYST